MYVSELLSSKRPREAGKPRPSHAQIIDASTPFIVLETRGTFQQTYAYFNT